MHVTSAAPGARRRARHDRTGSDGHGIRAMATDSPISNAPRASPVSRSRARARRPRPIPRAPRSSPPTCSPPARPRWRRSGRRTPNASPRARRTLCGAAPFLAPLLIRHPDWLARLVDDELDAPRGADEYARAARRRAARRRRRRGARRCATSSTTSWRASPCAICGRRPTPSPTPRRCSPSCRTSPTRSSPRPSHRARRASPPRSARRAGTARRRRRRSRRASRVLGMGKLGGEELNYSSDVDLIYVLESPPGGATHARRRAGGLVAARVLQPRRARVRPPGHASRRATASSIASISTCAPRDRPGPLVVAERHARRLLRRRGPRPGRRPRS